MLRFRDLLGLKEPRSHMVILVVVFYAFGFTMLFQSSRYYNTPSYANLLQLMRPELWGVIYIFAASLKVLSIVRQDSMKLIFATHILSLMLLLFWWVAFWIRYFTDNGTTIVNVCTWGLMVYLVIRSGLLMAGHVRRGD